MSKELIKWLQRLAVQDTVREELGDDIDFYQEFPSFQELYDAIYLDGMIDMARKILKDIK